MESELSRYATAIVALVIVLGACGGSGPGPRATDSEVIGQASAGSSAATAPRDATPSPASAAPRTTARPSLAPTKPPAAPELGPRPSFAVGDVVVTVTDDLRVRSRARVSSDSVKYEPVLELGTELRIVSGPVAASGYWWYRIRIVDGTTLRDGITAGWVAASDHDGSAWIDAYMGDTDPVPEPEGPALPAPVLAIEGSASYVDASGSWNVRHGMSITNWADYSAELIAALPGEESCIGRTWVDVMDSDTDDRIYGFCGFTAPSDLAEIWFPTPAGFAPPRLVRVDLSDRQTGQWASSNAVNVCPLDWGPSCER